MGKNMFQSLYFHVATYLLHRLHSTTYKMSLHDDDTISMFEYLNWSVRSDRC